MAINITEKSGEYGISVEKLLSGLAREAFAYAVSKSSAAEYMWLKFTLEAGVDSYKAVISRKLNYGYAESDAKSPNYAEIISYINEIEGITATYNEIFGGVELDLKIEGMYVPLTVYVDKIKSTGQAPIKKTVDLVLIDQEIEYLRYPSEAGVVELVLVICEKMEFMTDMSVYYNLYNEISNTALEGKLIWKSFNDIIKARGEEIFPGFPNVLERLSRNKNLERKWNNYLKRHNNMSKSWAEVINLVSSLVSPLWSSLVQGEVFVGDWMPELGRYL